MTGPYYNILGQRSAMLLPAFLSKLLAVETKAHFELNHWGEVSDVIRWLITGLGA